MEEDFEECLHSRAVPQVGIDCMKRDRVVNKKKDYICPQIKGQDSSAKSEN